MFNKPLTEAQRANITDGELRKYFINASLNGVAGVMVVVLSVLFGIERASFSLTNTLWGAAMLAFCAFRIYHSTIMFPKPDADEKSIIHWQRLLHIYALVVGLLWVCLPLFNIEVMTRIPGVYTAILLGILTGGVFSLNRFFWAYILYTVPIGIYLIGYHYLTGGADGKVLALLIFMFMGAAIIYARKTRDIYSQAFELRTRNDGLISTLEKKKIDLEVAKNKAELANQEKSKFLAAASHDIRQPLHALGFYLSAMGKHIEGDKGSEILSKSESSLNSLNELLNALIGISQLDAGDVEISPKHIKLKETLEPLCDELQVSANIKGIKVELNANNEVVHCDEILLKRSIRNLVINAIKHSGCNNVIVESRVAKNSQDFVEIEVSDNGTGMPQDHLETIFKNFEQLENEQRDRSQGHGLGLAIVQRLAFLQGHKIQASSSEKGTTFTLSIARGNEDFVIKDRSNQGAEGQIKQDNILVIDDELPVLDSVALTLESWGLDVKCASTGQQAVDEIKNGFSANIIISDYNLVGEETGIDAVAKLKQHLSPDTQVIYATGDVTKERMTKLRKLGYPILPKPIKPLMLKNMIKLLNNKPELGRIGNK